MTENTSDNKVENSEKDTYDAEDTEPSLDEAVKALRDVPPSDRKQIETVLQSTVGMIEHTSPETELFKKVTPEHITHYLDDSRDNMHLGYKDRTQNRVFKGFLVVVGMVAFIVIIVLLKDKPDILEKVLYAAGGLVAGAFGGYGFGKKNSGDNDSN